MQAESKKPGEGGNLEVERDSFRTFIFSWSKRSRRYWLVAGMALLVVVLYVLFSLRNGRAGLPLDDSWIHQTYARNLASSGRWEFVSGTVSSGSTAPLYSLLLAIGYLVRLPHLPWTYFLGWIFLVWSAWAAMSLWETLWAENSSQSWLPGILVVTSWSLVWAAASGMETILFIALALQLMSVYARQLTTGRWQAYRLGLLGGLLIMVRPEGLGLVLFVILGILVADGQPRDRVGRLLKMLVTAVIPLVPYFALNLLAGHQFWPNTFYAKQAEYGILWQDALPARFFRLLVFSLGGPEHGWQGMSGARLLLLPGLILAAYSAFRSDIAGRRLLYLLPLVWAGGHIFIYAWRLPVTYQHGRYLIPVIPVFLLFGLAGWTRLFRWFEARLGSGNRVGFIVKSVLRLTFAVIALFFLVLGLQVYAQDVALINGEMVAVAEWLQDNTAEDALIAAHDIGAIGYFTDRSLLDLAGLISPEVIPYLRDQDLVTGFALQSGADYLVTAPGWTYPAISQDPQSSAVYSSGYAWTVEQGSNNMTVYRLR